jgi:hypothetical protein
MSLWVSDEPDTLGGDALGRLIAHLERFPKAEECPVCGGFEWDTPTLKEHSVFVQDRFQRMTGTLVVSLVCPCCYYVRQFAWRGIERSAVCGTTGSASV